MFVALPFYPVALKICGLATHVHLILLALSQAEDTSCSCKFPPANTSPRKYKGCHHIDFPIPDTEFARLTRVASLDPTDPCIHAGTLACDMYRHAGILISTAPVPILLFDPRNGCHFLSWGLLPERKAHRTLVPCHVSPSLVHRAWY